MVYNYVCEPGFRIVFGPQWNRCTIVIVKRCSVHALIQSTFQKTEGDAKVGESIDSIEARATPSPVQNTTSRTLQ